MSQKDYGHGNGVGGRRNRTSRMVMFLRLLVIGYVIAIGFGWLTNGFIHWIPPQGKVGHEFSDGVVSIGDQWRMFFAYMFITVPVACAGILVFPWLIMTVVAHAMNQNNPEFKQWIQEGGSPFWDYFMPWPINPDSKIVRRGGIDPIKPVPSHIYVDPTWPYYCLTCYNRLPHKESPCGVCAGATPEPSPHPRAVPMDTRSVP